MVQGDEVDPNAPQEFEVSTLNFKRGSKKLRMSRTFGDFYLKQNDSLPPEQQAVCAVPDVIVRSRSPR